MPGKHTSYRSTSQNSNTFIQVDKLQQILDRLNGSAMAKLNQSAIQKTANEVKIDVKSKFKDKLNAADNPNPKYTDVLLDAVRQGANSKYPATPSFAKTIVHILGSGAKGSMGFIARFFEGGTQDRGLKDQMRRVSRKKNSEKYVAKKKHFKGKIDPLWFFRDTISSYSQSKVQVNITEVLERHIRNIITSTTQ